MIQLRDYQKNAFRGASESMGKGFKAPLLVLPTGGGKTVIFCYTARHVASKGIRVLILVHRIELIRQTSKALDKFGVEHGIINPKFTPNPHALVQIGSIQTVSSRLHLIDRNFGLVIVDEAHHVVADTYRSILGHMPAKCRVLGVTATPCRGDGLGLGIEVGGVFDDLVMGPQISELINMGYLVEPHVYMPDKHLDMISLRKIKDSEKGKMERIMAASEITGDAIEHYQKYAHGLPAVAFCVSVRHAELVAEQFRKAGYKAAYVDGKMDDVTRKNTLDGLEDGSMNVVTSCDLISEGFDLPAIGCAILLRQTKSLGLYLQQVGRALRPVEGKDGAIILDHAGNCLMHGLPDWHREWSLSGEAPRKKSESEDDDDEDEIVAPKITQCGAPCYAVYVPTGKGCPECGRMKAEKALPKAATGNLRRMTPEEKELMRQQQKAESMAKKKQVSRAHSKEELEAIAQERGYKAGWVENIMKSRGHIHA